METGQVWRKQVEKRDSVNTRGNGRVILEGASQHFVWSWVPPSHLSHKLKMQEVSPEAVTEQGGDLQINPSQL